MSSVKLLMGLWGDAPALILVPCMGGTLGLGLSKQHHSGLQHHCLFHSPDIQGMSLFFPWTRLMAEDVSRGHSL